MSSFKVESPQREQSDIDIMTKIVAELAVLINQRDAFITSKGLLEEFLQYQKEQNDALVPTREFV